MKMSKKTTKYNNVLLKTHLFTEEELGILFESISAKLHVATDICTPDLDQRLKIITLSRLLEKVSIT